MTEDQIPEPAEWPAYVDDRSHPFGPIDVAAQLCAYCAAGNMNAAWQMRVRKRDTPNVMTEIRAGENLALLAAGCWPAKFDVLDGSNCIVSVRAITTVRGTAVCKFHVHDALRNLR